MEKEIEKLFDSLEEAMRERQYQLVDESEDSRVKNLKFYETDYDIRFENKSLYLFVNYEYEYELNGDHYNKKTTKRITSFEDTEYIVSDVLYEVDELITRNYENHADDYDEDDR